MGGTSSRPRLGLHSGEGPSAPILGVAQHVLLGVSMELGTHGFGERMSLQSLSNVCHCHPCLYFRMKKMQSEEGSAGPRGQ